MPSTCFLAIEVNFDALSIVPSPPITITISIFSSVGELYNAFKIGNIDLVSTQNSNLKEYIGTIGYF